MERIPLKWDSIEFDRCPFCECCEYIDGPQAGAAANIKCVACGAVYNDMGSLGIELISWPEKTPWALRRIE